MCVASGEDMAHEHVHHDTAVVHRGPLDCQVHRGLVGVPLRPHHDGAAASPRPPQDFRRTGAPSGRLGFMRYAWNFRPFATIIQSRIALIYLFCRKCNIG